MLREEKRALKGEPNLTVEDEQEVWEHTKDIYDYMNQGDASLLPTVEQFKKE